MEEIKFEPIGIIKTKKKYRYETPRQAVLGEENKAVIKLYPGRNFEQALTELEGFERIWVLYTFHLNKNWKPKVHPPFHSEKKIGVFATRAPYRPNPIGMSCVRLLKIEKLNLFIAESDILDGSPVIDIKPYLPYSDSFPGSRTGWAEKEIGNRFRIIIETVAQEQIEWLEKNGKIYLKDFIKLQLETNPDNNSRKRIYKLDNNENQAEYALAYRTWRINYKISNDDTTIKVFSISSGYAAAELQDIEDDKYKDKSLHLLFNKTFV